MRTCLSPQLVSIPCRPLALLTTLQPALMLAQRRSTHIRADASLRQPEQARLLDVCSYCKLMRCNKQDGPLAGVNMSAVAKDSGAFLPAPVVLEGAACGPLKGLTFGAKDLYDVRLWSLPLALKLCSLAAVCQALFSSSTICLLL